MKMRMPHLGLEWRLVPDADLQMAYDVLLHLYQADTDDGMTVAKATFFSLTEELLEKYSPPFEGGEEWDTRRREREEEWR